MWIGIDFGTTNTSAAWFDGEALHYVPLDPCNSSPQNLRSMIYIDNQHKIRLGTEAVQTFLRDDTGRPVILEDKVVGTIENTVAQQSRAPGEPDGPITIIYDVVIQDDVGVRGRLLQSIKTALRAASYEGTQIFDRYYRVEALIALLLGHVKQQAEAHLGQAVTHAVIGRPVTFAHDEAVDRSAEAKIRLAAELAGFTQVEFMPEPVAAAAFYAHRAAQAQTVLVFDFGGGTLDLTVLRVDGRGQDEVLASVGVLVGGDDLDRAIMREHVAPHFGTQSPIDINFDGRPIAFPENMAELLDQWQTIPQLTRPHYLEVIERAIHNSDHRAAFVALETLATQNYGFALFQAIEQAKCALSDQMHSTIDLHMAQNELQIALSRAEFNALIALERSEVRAGIRAALRAAGITADQVDAVVATGGSSSIPAFQALLRAEIPHARMVASDAFGSVTGGLAMFAHRREVGEAGKENLSKGVTL